MMSAPQLQLKSLRPCVAKSWILKACCRFYAAAVTRPPAISAMLTHFDKANALVQPPGPMLEKYAASRIYGYVAEPPSLEAPAAAHGKRALDLLRLVTRGQRRWCKRKLFYLMYLRRSSIGQLTLKFGIGARRSI